MANQPTGPIISETIPEQSLDPLKNLDWDDLKLDWWGMYPSFKVPEWEKKEQLWKKENELSLNENILDKNSENPATPILKRINGINGVHIWDEDLEKIYDNMSDINNEDDVISNLLGALDKSWINQKTKELLNSILLQIGKNNDDRLKEGKDKEVVLPEEFKGNKLLESDKYTNIVNLLAKNYIAFPDSDNWDANFEKDLRLSIDTTVNKIIYGKQIPKTQWFEKAINDIKTWELETQLEALNYVYLLVNTNEWKEWKASKLSYKKIKQKENWEKESLQNRFDDIQKKSKELIVSGDIEKLKLLEQDILDVKEEADNDWEIFISSDLEKIQWEIDSVLKETT